MVVQTAVGMVVLTAVSKANVRVSWMVARWVHQWVVQRVDQKEHLTAAHWEGLWVEH